MEKKKAYIVNCAACDARSVQEATLAAYERVGINAAAVIVSPQSKVLLDQYGVLINTSNIVETDEDVCLSTWNGTMTLSPSKAPDKASYLILNGSMTIEPGCEEALKKYVGITVNGVVTCPESLCGEMDRVTVNGKLETYPDGCVMLKRKAVLDRLFHLRVKENARYYAAKKVVALDGGIRFDKLAEKNASFVTKELLVSESLAEAAVPLFDEKTDITVLPDGCAYVPDDAALDENLVSRYGPALYVDGNLTITAEGAPWLDKLQFLRVNGNLRTVKSMAPALARLNAQYDSLQIIGDVSIVDYASVTVTSAMLQNASEGVSITDCVNVSFSEDIPPELISEKLVSLTGCVNVCCTGEQYDVLAGIAKDVVHIGTSSGQASAEQDDDTDDIAELLGLDPKALSPEEAAELRKNSRVVNGSTVTL